MKLWKITPPEWLGYDKHTGAIVAAPSEEEACKIHPNNWAKGWPFIFPAGPYGETWDYVYGTWVPSPAEVCVELIGEALPDTPMGVVFSGFHAG